MASGQQRREYLFNLGAAALQRIRPDLPPDHYVCPLCLGGFSRLALTSGHLTLEDAPPRWIGGGRIALTCRDCNSSAGLALEPEMQLFEHMFDFAQGTMDRAIPAELRGPAGSANVAMRAHGGNIFVLGPPRSNNPDAQTAFEAKLPDLFRTPGARFSVGPTSGFRFKQSKVGWLKSAYIVAFAALGYRYAASPELKPIRQQIASPQQELISGFWGNQPHADRRMKQLGLVRYEKNVASVAVQMGRHIVFRPVLGGGDVYAHVAATLGKGSGAPFKFDAEMWPWPTAPVMAMDQSGS
jgi:hypothetical protein